MGKKEPIVPSAGFMEYDPYLSFWDQPRLLRGLLSILGVSCVMIWVEVLFHKLILLPEANAAVKNPIRCQHKTLPKPIDEMTDEELKEAFGGSGSGIDFSAMLGISGSIGSDRASLMGLYNLEATKLDKANNYAYLSMFIPFFVVLFLMYQTYYKLKTDRYRHHVVPVFGGYAIEGVVLSVLLSVVIFTVFQVVFYFYGREFEFETGGEMAAELRDFADQELFYNYIPDLVLKAFGIKNKGPNYGPKAIYNGGLFLDQKNWSLEQWLYPRPLDKTVKHLDPLVDDLTTKKFGCTESNRTCINYEFPCVYQTRNEPNYQNSGDFQKLEGVYCKDIEGLAAIGYEYKEVSPKWQEKYQTTFNSVNYCNLTFWEAKYGIVDPNQPDTDPSKFGIDLDRAYGKEFTPARYITPDVVTPAYKS